MEESSSLGAGEDLIILNQEDEDYFLDFDDNFFFPETFQIFAHLLFNLVMTLGLLGNICVLLIFTVKKTHLRKKLPTPLLANLAFSDLLITIFCLETGYLSLLWQYWPFGKALCFALSPIKPISVFVSSYTLIALSIDRYFQIKNPMIIGIFSRNYKFTIGIIWLLAICTSLPVAFFTSYEIQLSTGLPRCGEYAWESETKEIIYDVILITLQYIAPVLVLISTYTNISTLVEKNRKIRHRMSQGTFQRTKNLRTVRMSIMIVLGYTIAWLPYNIVSLLAKYHRTSIDSNQFPYIFVMSHWLAMSHTVYNPIIYFWLNKSFRLHLLELFCSQTVKRRRMMSTLSWRSNNGGDGNASGRQFSNRQSTIVMSGRSFSESVYNNSFVQKRPLTESESSGGSEIPKIHNNNYYKTISQEDSSKENKVTLDN